MPHIFHFKEESIVYTDLHTLPLVLTEDEAARDLGISRHLLYALLRSGQIRSLRVGRIFRVPRCALEEYLGLAG